jgi:hypothetical protein
MKALSVAIGLLFLVNFAEARKAVAAPSITDFQVEISFMTKSPFKPFIYSFTFHGNANGSGKYRCRLWENAKAVSNAGQLSADAVNAFLTGLDRHGVWVLQTERWPLIDEPCYRVSIWSRDRKHYFRFQGALTRAHERFVDYIDVSIVGVQWRRLREKVGVRE